MSKTPIGQGPESIGANASESKSTPIESAEVDPHLRERIEKAIGGVVAQGQRGQVVERVTQIIAAEAFRGPLPHPRHLEQYEKIVPGLADRIVTMAELSLTSEESRLDRIVNFEYADRRLGMHLGFLALLVLLGCGTLITLFGNVVVGTGIITAAIIGTVAGTFVHGRNNFFGRNHVQDSSGEKLPEKAKK